MARQTDIRERIIEASRELFSRYGFTKVTTDEIAAAAGISKKTLYQYFESKENLIWDVVSETGDNMRRAVEAIITDEGMSFTDKLRSFTELRAGMSSRLKPFLVEDAMRNFPRVWKQFEEIRNVQFGSFLDRLIEEGIKQNVVRKDVDKSILELVCMGSINTIINPETLCSVPYSQQDAVDAIIKIIFVGVLTDEAREEYKSFLKKSQKKK